MKEFTRLLRLLGPYRRDLVIGCLMVLVESVLELIIPVLMSDIIDVIDGKVISWTCYISGIIDKFVDVTPKVMKRYLLGE